MLRVGGWRHPLVMEMVSFLSTPRPCLGGLSLVLRAGSAGDPCATLGKRMALPGPPLPAYLVGQMSLHLFQVYLGI